MADFTALCGNGKLMSTYSLESRRITGMEAVFDAAFFPESFFATTGVGVGLRAAVAGFLVAAELVLRPVGDLPVTGGAGFATVFGFATGTTLARGTAAFGEDFAGTRAAGFVAGLAGLAAGLEDPSGFAVAAAFRSEPAFARDSAALPSWTKPKAPPANSRIINSPVFTAPG